MLGPWPFLLPNPVHIAVSEVFRLLTFKLPVIPKTTNLGFFASVLRGRKKS